jgi:hypothetical protein
MHPSLLLLARLCSLIPLQTWAHAFLSLLFQVEEIDQPSISHVAGFDDGASIADFDFEELNLKKPLTDAGKRELAYLYRHIQMLYAKVRFRLIA